MKKLFIHKQTQIIRKKFTKNGKIVKNCLKNSLAPNFANFFNFSYIILKIVKK